MPMEAEVPMLFLTCFTVVFLIKALAGTSLVRKQKGCVVLWVGHLACELASFFFLFRVMFAGWLPLFSLGPDPSMYSENASVAIGLFGVFWAFSTFLLLAVLANYLKNRK